MMKLIPSQFDSYCRECHKSIDKGDDIYYDLETKWAYHIDCEPSESNEDMKFSSKDDRYRKPVNYKSEEEAERLIQNKCSHPDEFLHSIQLIKNVNPVLKCFKCGFIFSKDINK